MFVILSENVSNALEVDWVSITIAALSLLISFGALWYTKKNYVLTEQKFKKENTPQHDFEFSKERNAVVITNTGNCGILIKNIRIYGKRQYDKETKELEYIKTSSNIPMPDYKTCSCPVEPAKQLRFAIWSQVVNEGKFLMIDKIEYTINGKKFTRNI